jgi:predicted RNA-binding protein
LEKKCETNWAGSWKRTRAFCYRMKPILMGEGHVCMKRQIKAVSIHNSSRWSCMLNGL